MPQNKLPGIIRNLIHDALYKCGLTFAVFADKSHFLTAVNSEIYIVKYDMASVRFGNIFTDNGIVTATAAAHKLQP